MSTPINKGEIERLADSLEAWGPMVSSGYEVPAAGQVMLDSARNLRFLLTQLSEAEAALPTTDEAFAYAKGYEEGLRDAKEQDVAKLIVERDTAAANFAFEKVLRQEAERHCDELKARLATSPERNTR